MSTDPATAFIARRSTASPSERANSQLFLSELCDLLDVPRPSPARDHGYPLTVIITKAIPVDVSEDGSLRYALNARICQHPVRIANLRARGNQILLAHPGEAGRETKERGRHGPRFALR